jgi:hypothetical protein
MNPRGPTSLADLVVVAGTLGADPDTLRRAAHLLGLAAAPAPAVSVPVVRTPRPAERVGTAPSPRAAAERDRGDGVVRPAGPDPRPARRPRLVTHPPAVVPRPAPVPVETLLPPVGPVPPAGSSTTGPGGSGPTAPAGPEPLLRRSHQRAVLSALAAVARPGPEVDVDRLVRHAAVREPVVEVPRLSAPTTRLGIQLLLDDGPSMGPFRGDLWTLADAFRLVVGTSAVEELVCDGSPRTVVDRLTGEERPYRPAGPRPVVVAGDLGVGDPGASRATHADDWLWLAETAHRAGSPLVVLTPYPPTRWPAWAAPLTLIHWDRATDAATARRAARRAATRLRRGPR